MFNSLFRKRICISFDWHNDRHYRHLLRAWVANPNNPIDFQDLTPGEIDTNAIDRIKARLTTQIRAADYTLVLVGAYANAPHKDRAKIGILNWIWWEVEQSKAEGKRLIAVKINRSFASPEPLLNARASWAFDFNQAAVLKAINDA